MNLQIKNPLPVLVFSCFMLSQASLLGMLPVQFHRVNLDKMPASQVKNILKGPQGLSSSSLTKNLQLRNFGKSYFQALCSWLFSKRSEIDKTKKYYREDFPSLGVKYIDQVERLKENHDPCYQINLDFFGQTLPDNQNKLLEAGYHAPVYIKYVNDSVGYGVYADKEIDKDEFIGQYTGQEEVINLKNNSDYTWSMFHVERSIDAKTAGNYTRYINHSFNPNIVMRYIKHNNQWHVVYVALRPIKKDEPLLVNYGISYWGSRKIIPAPLDSWPHKLQSYLALFNFRKLWNLH